MLVERLKQFRDIEKCVVVVVMVDEWWMVVKEEGNSKTCVGEKLKTSEILVMRPLENFLILVRHWPHDGER